MSEIRRPAVAGQFYPGDREELLGVLDALFSYAPTPEAVNGELMGLISPHAGYAYSGTVAAAGYKLVKGLPIKNVVLLGPSHQAVFSGVAAYPSGKWVTPFGEIEVNSEFVAELTSRSKTIFPNTIFHTAEHSIEVQLPFLQYILDEEFRIAPLLVGAVTMELIEEAADVLAEALEGLDDWILIMSSDLYHGYSYEECRITDSKTIAHILDLNESEFYMCIKQGECEACGYGGITIGMKALKKLGVNSAMLNFYTNSAEITGNYVGYVVGYASISFSRMGVDERPSLTEDEKEELLDIAKKSVEAAVRGEPIPEFSPKSQRLQEPWGAFVTLKKHGQLRGCIGYIVGLKPLYQTVQDVAISAALNDPRFPPVTPDELPYLSYEVSVLTPLQRVSDVNEIQVGRDGLLIKRGPYQGLLLPQVATEEGWDRKTFLDHTCLKAGLRPGCWHDPSTEIYRFEAIVFGDEE